MEKISRKEKVSYGMGDLACNTVFTVVSSYLMFFYTDIAGIGLAAVGTIMMIARIVDAVTDPMMGIIIDKTNTKWGKARPYVLWMAVPFAVISVLMFLSPDVGSTGKFVYALITYVMFCVVYTALNIPYQSMLSNLTDNDGERLSFNMFKQIGSSMGGFVATGFTLFLVAKLGAGNQQKGFPLAIMIYGLVAILLLVTCFKNTRERIAPVNESVSLKDSFRAASKNKPWMILCVLAFLAFTGIIIWGQGAMYFAKYYLGKESAAASLMAIPNLMAIPLAAVTPAIAKRVGKRNCVLGGNILLAASLVGTAFMGKNFVAILMCAVIGALGSGIAIGVSFVMSAEAVDYSEWLTGVRAQGLLTASSGFMVKLGMAVAAAVSAAILASGGYVENAVQTESALTAIRMNYIWVPAGIAVLSSIISLFYDLDKKYESIVDELHERRKGGK